MDRAQFNSIYNQAITDYETIDTYRKGQCLFSLFNLYLYEEQWFRDLIGTNKDCFYNDNNIDKFLTEIKKHLTDMKYIDIPEGYELDLEKTTSKCIVLSPIYPTYRDILESPVTVEYTVKQVERVDALAKLFDIANYYNKGEKPKEDVFYIYKNEKGYNTYLASPYEVGMPYFINRKDAQKVIDNPNFIDILNSIYGN